jgi:hypothetical protein
MIFMTYSVHLQINNVYTHMFIYLNMYVFGYTHAYAYECSAFVVYPIRKKKRIYSITCYAVLPFQAFNYQVGTYKNLCFLKDVFYRIQIHCQSCIVRLKRLGKENCRLRRMLLNFHELPELNRQILSGWNSPSKRERGVGDTEPLSNSLLHSLHVKSSVCRDSQEYPSFSF